MKTTLHYYATLQTGSYELRQDGFITFNREGGASLHWEESQREIRKSITDSLLAGVIEHPSLTSADIEWARVHAPQRLIIHSLTVIEES